MRGRSRKNSARWILYTLLWCRARVQIMRLPLQGEGSCCGAILPFGCSPFMYRSSLGFLAPFLSVFLSLPVPPASAQAAPDPSTSAKQGIALAERGNCKPALPILKRATSRLTDKQLKFNAAMLTARCAMSIGQTDTAVEALLLLNREFPRDPEVLYTTTHFYSELASRASRKWLPPRP